MGRKVTDPGGKIILKRNVNARCKRIVTILAMRITTKDGNPIILENT